MKLLKSVKDNLPDCYNIKVYGKYTNDLYGKDVVKITTYIDCYGESYQYDYSLIYKPSRFSKKTWKEACEIKIDKMIEDAINYIHTKEFRRKVNGGLLDSLDEL